MTHYLVKHAERPDSLFGNRGNGAHPRSTRKRPEGDPMSLWLLLLIVLLVVLLFGGVGYARR